MNPILAKYLADTSLDEYQALRDQLLNVVTDADLGTQLGGGTPTLGDREALLTCYGKASICLRALSKPFPGQLAHWIG